MLCVKVDECLLYGVKGIFVVGKKCTVGRDSELNFVR